MRVRKLVVVAVFFSGICWSGFGATQSASQTTKPATRQMNHAPFWSPTENLILFDSDRDRDVEGAVMEFDLDQAIALLSKTPATLQAWLKDLPREWLQNNEGGETWSPYDVLGHLIHGERTDWLPRARIILEQGEARQFEPFDRFAQFSESQGKSVAELLAEFAALREQNLKALGEMQLAAAELAKTGQHPALGRVRLKELLATWVTHDLDHVGQIARVMAKQYASEVGPWTAYISILHDRR
jgi:uncharacterized damage-inducible protein DinB